MFRWFQKVDYLVIKNGNLIKNKAIIRFDDIHFINKDQVVYIKAANDLDDKMERNISSEKEGSKLFNKEIIDENEECIGYVRDIVINKDNGKIEGFIITEGIFEDLIKGRNYLPLLDDTIIDDKAISIRSNILI